MKLGLKGWIGIAFGVLSMIGIVVGLKGLRRKRKDEDFLETEREIEKILEKRHKEVNDEIDSLLDQLPSYTKMRNEYRDKVDGAARRQVDSIRTDIKDLYGDDCDEEQILRGTLMDDGRSLWDWINNVFENIGTDSPLRNELKIDP